MLYAEAEKELLAFCEAHGIPVAETQAGKSATAGRPSAASRRDRRHRHRRRQRAAPRRPTSCWRSARGCSDFTTGSWALFKNPGRAASSASTCSRSTPASIARCRWSPTPRAGLAALDAALGDWRAPAAWTRGGDAQAKREWRARRARAISPPTNAPTPTDAQVLGAVQRAGEPSDIVVCAAGGLPGELHKLWQAGAPLGYHLEYGYSCMGYEIAGGLGVKLAQPDREVIVVVGDGSYLMMNSEIATSVMLGLKLIIVVLDNRGFGCINRLQRATGGASFNNLLRDARHEVLPRGRFRRACALARRGCGQGHLDRRTGSAFAAGARRPLDCR